MKSILLNLLLLANLLVGGVSYLVSDVIKLDINIHSDNSTFNLPITVTESNFKSKILGLPKGYTKINIDGLNDNDKAIFKGSWGGHIADNTNILINLIDLETKTILGNMPPYFETVNVEPSRIKLGDKVKVTVFSNDYNKVDIDNLNYEVELLGENNKGNINYIIKNQNRLVFEYVSSLEDTYGDKIIKISVSDLSNKISTYVSFMIDDFTEIETQIKINSNPEILSFKSDKTLILFSDYAIVTSDIIDIDDDNLQFKWNIETIKGSCLYDDLIGNKEGYTTSKKLSIQYKPSKRVISECKLSLLLRDNLGANTTGYLYLNTDTKIVNHNPSIIFGYQTSYSGKNNSDIDFILKIEETDGDSLRTVWDKEGQPGSLENRILFFENTNNNKPYIVTVTNKLITSGLSGKIICKIYDSYNLLTKYSFDIDNYNRLRRLNEKEEEVENLPVYFQIKNGEVIVTSDSTNKNSDTDVFYIDNNITCPKNDLIPVILVFIILIFIILVIYLVIYSIRRKSKIKPNKEIKTNETTVIERLNSIRKEPINSSRKLDPIKVKEIAAQRRRNHKKLLNPPPPSKPMITKMEQNN